MKKLVIAGFLVAANGFAQGGPATMQFGFSNPGARSLGYGGAFAALADDATAAFANPAGLIQITRPEISLELRAFGDISSITPDTVTSGLEATGSTTAASGVGFLAFVYPRGKWRFAFYRHQSVSLESSFAIRGVLDSVAAENESLFVDIESGSGLEIVTHAGSVAYRVSEKLSLGLGLAYFSGEAGMGTNISLFAGPSMEASPDSRESVRRLTLAGADDSNWAFNAGFLWHPLSRLSVGGFYRQAPSLNGGATTTTGSVEDPDFPEGTSSETSTGSLRLPDIFGFGVAYKSGGSFTAGAEWDHVRYSMTGSGLFANEQVDDTDEFHMGMEYAFIGIKPVIALRLGAWFDPEVRVRFPVEASLPDLTFRKGRNRWHGSFGVGMAFNRFQLDLGIDVSKLSATVSLSAIVGF